MEPRDTSEVNDFLVRIRELGEKTDREDELRAKQLEEEIAQGRKRRQALRAERARSMSPTKDGSVDMDYDHAENNNNVRKNATSPLRRDEDASAKMERLTLDDLDGPDHKAEKSSTNEQERKHEHEHEHERERPTPPNKPKSSDRAAEIKSQIENIVPSSTLKLFPDTKTQQEPTKSTPGTLRPAASIDRLEKKPSFDTNARNTPPSSTTAARPSIAPKPSNLSPNEKSKMPNEENKDSPLTRAQSSRHVKSSSFSSSSPVVLDVRSTTKLDPNSSSSNSPAEGFVGSRSPTRNESPTRRGGGFIRSAMMKRENTIRSSSPGNGGMNSSPPGFGSSPPQLRPSPSMRSNVSNRWTTVPKESEREELSKMLQERDDKAKSEKEEQEEKKEKEEKEKEESPPLTRSSTQRFNNANTGTSHTSSLLRSQSVLNTSLPSSPEKYMGKSDSIDSIASVQSSIPAQSTENTPLRAPRTLNPTHTQSSPASDSRRWSPVRQTTWLESALKKTNPPTPEQGLVRAGTLARSPSRSPQKSAENGGGSSTSGHTRTMSYDRLPLSSPLDLARESSPLTASAAAASNANASKPLSPSKSSTVLHNSPLSRSADSKPDYKKDNEENEQQQQQPQELPPAIARQRSLRPLPPKPNTGSKPSPEAIERLRSLRRQTTQKYQERDEAKEMLEQTKSTLRRSNTERFQARDDVKERLLAAKGSLRSQKENQPIAEDEEPEQKEQETIQSSPRTRQPARSPHRAQGPRKAKSFHDDLSSALTLGPQEPAKTTPSKAHTFDSASSTPGKGDKLSHITKSRAKGPKRRLPKEAKSDEHHTEELPPGQRPVTDKPPRHYPVPSGQAHRVPVALVPGEKDGLDVGKTRGTNKSGRPKPTIRTSSRTVSSKLNNNNSTPPPKPRTPSSQVRVKQQ